MDKDNIFCSDCTPMYGELLAKNPISIEGADPLKLP